MARFLLEDPSWVKNKSVLDFGSGSGIAGIAAHKAGAKRVVACDINLETAVGLAWECVYWVR